MHKDEIKGKAKELAGKAEQKLGEATGDDRHVATGASREREGKAQNVVGKVKDAAHKIID